jgi:tetratricopeptide (TPR) repeat protein
VIEQGLTISMGYSIHKARALAGLAILGLAGALVAAGVWGKPSPAQLAAEARQAVKRKDWSRAGSLLDRLSQRRPPTTDDVVLRAEVELGQGHADEAIRLLTGIPEADPVAANARMIAGQIEKTRGRARFAEALLLEATRLDPKLVPARRELIILYALQARRPDINAQYRALAELEPLTFEDVLLWTVSLEDIWINDTIRSDLERFLAADPEDRWSRLALAAVLLHAGELDEAEAVLRPLPDSDLDSRVMRARLALRRTQLDRARDLIDQGPADHAGLALLRGQFAIRMNDPVTAARQFHIALRLDPTDREAVHGLALVLQRSGQEEEAAALQKQAEQWRGMTSMLQRAQAPEGRHDRALMRQLGETCEALGQLAQARAWYRLALALDPLDPSVQQSLYRLREPSPEAPRGTGSDPDQRPGQGP